MIYIEPIIYDLKVTTIPFHKFCEIFPPMSKEEFISLKQSIKEKGQQDPIVLWKNQIVDGKHRYLACKELSIQIKCLEYEGEEKDLLDYVIAKNLERRHLTASQKATLGEDLKPFYSELAEKRMLSGKKLDPTAIMREGTASEHAAKVVGVSPRYIDYAEEIKRISPKNYEKVREGKLTIPQAKREINAIKNERSLLEAKKSITEQRIEDIKKVCDIRHCSCKDLFESGIKPDAVICDPPYTKETLEAFSELALSCQDIPIVAVMTGKFYLPEIMIRLCKHLKYRWMIANLTPGGEVTQWPVKFKAQWTPIIVFGQSNKWAQDVIRSEAKSKDSHKWGKSIDAFSDLIKQLTNPGDLICDPFIGGGTTAIASLSMERRFIGCDIEKESVDNSIARVHSFLKEKDNE